MAGCGHATPKAGSRAGAPPTTAKAVPPPTGTALRGGTVTWAMAPGPTPDDIFPMAGSGHFSRANISELQQLLYRPLYWFGTAGKPSVDFTKSIGKPPVWTDDDQTVTITLNDYTWSDGELVTARDVVFWMNLLTAEKRNWPPYEPGLFPDNVTGISMPDGPTGATVRLTLTQSFNPAWFLANELSQITPMPMAWDRLAAAGASPSATSVALPDATPPGAAKVYAYLTAAARSPGTYASSPLWSVVDGPWKLNQITPGGQVTFVPNPAYDGPDEPYLSKFVEVPYRSGADELTALAAGAFQVGTVAEQAAASPATVAADGYSASTLSPFGFNFMALNFNSTAAGPLFAPLYIRQALQELIDQPTWVDTDLGRTARPTSGPVPVLPPNSFSAAVEKRNPYPFSVSSAMALLAGHGWTVSPNGTTRCAVAVRCGPGIRAGEALSFRLDYAAGSAPLARTVAAYRAAAAEAGVHLTVVPEAYDEVVAEAVPADPTWQIADWGSGWTYAYPDYYPSGESLFRTGGASNHGAYSDPTADALIHATITAGISGAQAALDAYQHYIADQVPVLFQPQTGLQYLVVKDLGGTALQPNAFLNLDPESWYYVTGQQA